MAEPSLKDQLFALCDEHGLNYIHVAVYATATGNRFLGASVHAGGLVGFNHTHEDGAAEAISNAIADLNEKRHGKPFVAELAAA